MTKKKGRTGWHQKTAFDTTSANRYFTSLASLLKGLIEMLPVGGWFPIALDDRFNHQGESHDE